MFIEACWVHTASKLPSGEGMASLFPQAKDTRSVRRYRAFAPMFAMIRSCLLPLLQDDCGGVRVAGEISPSTATPE
jgi:hypothetical protein